MLVLVPRQTHQAPIQDSQDNGDKSGFLQLGCPMQEVGYSIHYNVVHIYIYISIVAGRLTQYLPVLQSGKKKEAIPIGLP